MITPALHPSDYWAGPGQVFYYGHTDTGPYLGTTPKDGCLSVWVPSGWEDIAKTLWVSEKIHPQSFHTVLLDYFQRGINKAVGAPLYPPKDKTKSTHTVWYGSYLKGRSRRPFCVLSKDYVPLRVDWVCSGTVRTVDLDPLVQWLHTSTKHSVSTPPESETSSAQVPTQMAKGSVVVKDDGSIAHVCVWMGRHGGANKLLVLTTNPRWNPNCRTLQREELIAMGHPVRDRHSKQGSYIAPYLTIEDHLIPTGVSLSELRVDALEREFCGKYLTDSQLHEAWQTRMAGAAS